MSEASLRVVTPHASVAEFISHFSRVVRDRHMLLSLRRARPQGAMLRFSVRLADGQPVFEGLGRVVDLHENSDGATVGARIELLELDAESETMHRCLMLARAGASRPSVPEHTPLPDFTTPLPSRASGPTAGPVVRPLTADEDRAWGEPSAVLTDRTRRDLAIFAFYVLVAVFVGAGLLGLR